MEFIKPVTEIYSRREYSNLRSSINFKLSNQVTTTLYNYQNLHIVYRNTSVLVSMCQKINLRKYLYAFRPHINLQHCRIIQLMFTWVCNVIDNVTYFGKHHTFHVIYSKWHRQEPNVYYFSQT